MHRQLRKYVHFCAFGSEGTFPHAVAVHFCHNTKNTILKRHLVGYVPSKRRRNNVTFYRSLSSEHSKVDPDPCTESDSGLEVVRNKILFNSVLNGRSMRSSWISRKVTQEIKFRKQLQKIQNQVGKDIPLAVKYLKNTSDLPVKSIDNEKKDDPPVHLPFGDLGHSEANAVLKLSSEEEEQEEDKKIQNWMRDYEFYDESESRPWQLNYGTADATVPVSKVPCGGCGALLHCQDTAIPGFLPRELFLYRSDAELRSMKCQRCHFLSHYNVALNVNVSPEEYPRLLGHIKDRRALVILMVDLTDFPCSIWPGIIDIIGTRRPVVVVGNKVDLLPADGPAFLEHVSTCLTTSLDQMGLGTANIRHVALVSATTGFGVEELITKLHNIWDYKDDIYLMGCTNVGKSTLFNALLQSDLCKVKAVDLLQRATTSQWPGTTLNLLKFPILRPAGWRLQLRMERLMKESKNNIMERKLRSIQARKEKDPTRATLIGHIGRTFRDPSHMLGGQDPFSMGLSANSPVQRMGLDPNDEEFRDGRWCYDTPGTVQPDQVLNLLTTRELMLTLPRQILLPRTFSVRPGQSLLLAGLARLDYLGGDDFVRMTVLASDKLPLTMCYTSDADAIYDELVGSTYLGVPCGKSERLARWPGLSPHNQVLRVQGCGWQESAADVVLSSAGWVAITPGPDMTCEFQAWTPHGRGVYLRQPPLLRYSVNLRGPRLRKTPAYKQGQAVYVKNYPS